MDYYDEDGKMGYYDEGYYDEDGHYHSFRHGIHKTADRILRSEDSYDGDIRDRERVSVMESGRERRTDIASAAPGFLRDAQRSDPGPVIVRQRETVGCRRCKSPDPARASTTTIDVPQGRSIERPRPAHYSRSAPDEVDARRPEPRMDGEEVLRDRGSDRGYYVEREDRTGVNTHHIDKYVWDVSQSKDLTIHLELNVVDDPGPDLDDFCRLAKLGNFKAANEFFFENLQAQMSNPYVFVQYAQMLLDMADYAGVTALRSPHGLDDIAILDVNWRLVRLLAELHIKGVSESHVKFAATEAVDLLQAGPLGSTEVQVLCLVLRLLAQRYPYVEDKDLDVGHKFRWAVIYDNLLAEGRVWDFRDLFVASLLYSDREETCIRFLDVHFDSPSLLDTLVGDWLTETFDEPTSLALLDILTSLCLGSTLRPGARTTVKRCLEYSRSIASFVAENDANLLMTRSYLRWSLTKVRVATYSELSTESGPLSKLPGQFVFKNLAMDLPLYAPKQSETVDWKLLTLPSHANGSIQIVLNAAKQLGDYDTESMCRKMLIYRSQDPLKQLEELITLQKTAQRDVHGCLHTILTKYMVCNDETYRKRLRDEILAIEDWGNFESTLQRTRVKVLRAVSDPDPDEVLSHQAETLKKELRDGDFPKEADAAKPGDQDSISKLPTDPVHDKGNLLAAPGAVRLEDKTHVNAHDQTALQPARNDINDSDLEEIIVDAAGWISGTEDTDGEGENAARPSDRKLPLDTSSSAGEENGHDLLGAGTNRMDQQTSSVYLPRAKTLTHEHPPPQKDQNKAAGAAIPSGTLSNPEEAWFRPHERRRSGLRDEIAELQEPGVGDQVERSANAARP